MRIVLLLKNLETKAFQELTFDRMPLLFGRSRICDVTIADPLLSRQQCSLEIKDKNKLKLLDLNSANGTFVNGQRITEATLSVDQSFTLGQTEVRIVQFDEAEEETTLEDIVIEKSVSLQGKTKLKESEKAAPAPTAKKSVEAAPVKSVQAAAKEPEVSAKRQSDDLTMKTPVMLKGNRASSAYKTKDWVQVSLLWKGELVDIQCFDQGDIVTIGSLASNSFIVNVPSLPENFRFLKILQNGVEVQLHPSMKGMVETRNSVRTLEELRTTSRQTELGLATFVQFTDRCLFEVGPFALYIQSVRLSLSSPLTAPLIKEPVFASILTSVFIFVLGFFLFVGQLTPAVEEEKKPEEPVVKLAPMDENFKAPPPPPPPPPPKPKAVEKGPVASKKQNLSGNQGEGAKSQGEEGRAGRTTGKVPTRARAIGIVSKAQPIRQAPKGALGEVTDPNQAKKGIRPDQGTGSGTPKPKGTGTQAPSKDLKPNVKVEDMGVLGALAKNDGGGGKAANGGVLSGKGLGGELEGSLEGLERGSDLDAKGSGGRGAQGIGLGGGGTSVEVGGLKTKGKGGGQSGFGLGSSGKKGEAEVSYSIEEVEVQDGLTREEIAKVVRSHQSEIQACYEKALIQSGNQALGGRLKARWTINLNGLAENLREESGVSDGGYLFNCVSQRVRSWQFPRPRGGKGVDVSWPWVFRKG
ncbi:MAG: FHA domain-containing protein [Deltaproteobacteria bacterium]|nr:FHA domain-containing protein [Deltaproteobacteria bacterium]